jgi:hypothetical protein
MAVIQRNGFDDEMPRCLRHHARNQSFGGPDGRQLVWCGNARIRREDDSGKEKKQ